ncbi:MAG TPA: hypothetical protein VGE01_13270 [Fimbriimonas sp.]
MRLFGHGDRPEEDRTEVWECHPLVVVHPVDGVVYARNTDVEFTPEKEFGVARALTPTSYGWYPEIRIDGWQEPVRLVTIPGYQAQQGRTLTGHNPVGDSFVWYIGRDAVEFLHRTGSSEADAADDSGISPS